MHINKTTFIAGMLVAVVLGAGLTISLQTASATAFITNLFGIQFGDGTRTMTLSTENLIYGVVADSAVGSLLLLQDGLGMDRFRVDVDGNVTADGTVTGDAPTADEHLTTKGYVDAQAGGGGTPGTWGCTVRSGSNTGFGWLNATATCVSPEKVITGGCNDVGGTSVMHRTYPKNQGWWCHGFNNNSRTLTAYANCCL
jgi:hypothetical protein